MIKLNQVVTISTNNGTVTRTVKIVASPDCFGEFVYREFLGESRKLGGMRHIANVSQIVPVAYSQSFYNSQLAELI